ncbi:MAG: serine/threonine-protein kinase [Gemmatimonadaceae bacterium]
MSGEHTTPPDRNAEIEAIFDDVIELPRERRSAFLAERCRGDEALQSEVEALLSGLDHAEQFFDPHAPAVSRMAREILPAAAGLRIGRYHVIRELGRGGMGVVYLAERADGHHRRRVAIKVVRLDDEGRDIRRRFLAEGRILASMSHPNIAQLLDAGVMEDGRPYIVMEYVDGETITAYCEQHQLTVVARLKLFQDVCAAIHHAHTNLVLHRDVKPGNILVTRDGRVKLLDFGIAKLLEGQADGDRARDETRTGARPMTPAYASPEQVRGEPLSTASDVYALGLVLYEILAGMRAYDVEAHSPATALALISDEEPPLPSTRGSRHSAELRDDLDAIVMMALRKEPAARYGSADQLSADIGRFLVGLPVLAHEDNRLYRLRRFVRRHRVAVLTTALLFTGVAGGLSVALWQAREARLARASADAARDQAVAARGESEQVADFLIGLFDNRDDYGSLRDTVVLRSLLSRGMKRLSEVREPLARASLLDALGRVQQNLENAGEAERFMWEALKLREQYAGSSAPSTALTLERLAEVLRRRGNYVRAESLGLRALAANRATYGNVHPRVEFDLRLLSSMAVYQSNLARAESLALAALDAGRADTPGADSVRVRQVETLGSLQWRRGNIDGAIASMKEAERLARLRHDYPDALASEMQLHRAALLRYYPGRLGEAVALARQGMAEQFVVVPPQDPRRVIAISWAAPIIALESPAEGLQLLRTALALQIENFGARTPTIIDLKEEMIIILLRMHQTAQATALARDVVVQAQQQYGTQHSAYASALGYLVDVLVQEGSLDSAEKVARRAIAIRTATFGSNAPITALASLGLARVAAARSDTVLADSVYGAARVNILRQTTTEHPDVRFVDSSWAAVRKPRGDARVSGAPPAAAHKN